MNKYRHCKNCSAPYSEHIDYTFTEYMEGDLVDALTEALPKIKCTRYKPMSNLEYLEYEADRRAPK